MGHLESCCEHQNFGTWTGHFTETCHGHSNYFFRYNWSYFIQACVPLPFVIVRGNLHFNKTLHSVTCINCKLYTCLDSSISLSYSILCSVQFSQFSRSVVSDSSQPHGPQHARPPCPSPTPRACSNSPPLSRWCYPTILSSVVPFSSCPQSFPASGSFPMSQFFTSGGQSIGVSASTSVLPMNTQDWSPLGWTGWISLQSKGLSRVFSNTTVQKHQFFNAQLSL